MTKTPREAGYRQPAEWARHDACWLAFPHLADEWGPDFEGAKRELLGLARGVLDVDPSTSAARGERIEMLVPSVEVEREARAVLGELPVRYHHIAFGDIWMRDIGPIFLVHEGGGELGAGCFRFNGWGGKYVYAGDDEVAGRVAAKAGARAFEMPWILEGGSVDVDGEGTVLTTRQCLLNPNRNPMGQREVEDGLRDGLGVERVIWLGDGLANDHTDGHVDTIARFVAPGVVVCMEPRDADDPNRDALLAIARDLTSATDARGRKLEVVRVPSPGTIRSGAGQLLPASYCNFYIANTTVVVPTYGSPHDDEAVARIGELFPGRRTIGAPARHILTGGGAFHCISQQQPTPAESRR